MTWLSDDALDRLRRPASLGGAPDDRYPLLDLIGSGGMGAVYRAVDRTLGRTVAMKVLHRHLGEDEAVARLVQEAKIIARLEHSGIVPVHDVGTLDDGRVFYIMKFVRGQRLDKAVADAGLSQRLGIFERVCECVAFAHARGVIHRDLKPQNIMVGEFGEVLLLDWGVAKVTRPVGAAVADALGAQESPQARVTPHDVGTTPIDNATRGGTVIGTPDYMSPEQARGEVEKIDARSDVYALGAILWHLLTGAPPATRSTSGAEVPSAGAVAGPKREGGQPPFPAPRALLAACRRAMNDQPEDRYPAVLDLAADVARFRNGQRVLAHREGPIDLLRRLGWKYAPAVLLVLAYLIMRVALILWGRR